MACRFVGGIPNGANPMTSPLGQDVLHWRDGSWHEIGWESWMHFRGLKTPWIPLPHVGPGEHYFVVCVQEDGRLFNILPHRYLIDNDGRIARDNYFGVLSAGEIERFEALDKRRYEYPQRHPLNDKENDEFGALRNRLWRSWLPTAGAMRQLMTVFPAMPHEDDAAWNVLAASGVTLPSYGRA
jgi:hypothetical protein